MKCYACGKIVSSLFKLQSLYTNYMKGHISRDCTAPNGGPLNAAGKVCYKCGQPGHISRDCTATEANGQLGLDGAADSVQQGSSSVVA